MRHMRNPSYPPRSEHDNHPLAWRLETAFVTTFGHLFVRRIEPIAGLDSWRFFDFQVQPSAGSHSDINLMSEGAKTEDVRGLERNRNHNKNMLRVPQHRPTKYLEQIHVDIFCGSKFRARVKLKSPGSPSTHPAHVVMQMFICEVLKRIAVRRRKA